MVHEPNFRMLMWNDRLKEFKVSEHYSPRPPTAQQLALLGTVTTYIQVGGKRVWFTTGDTRAPVNREASRLVDNNPIIRGDCFITWGDALTLEE